MDWTPYVAPLVTVAIAIITFYGMVNARLARMEQKMDDLSEDVRKHNGVVERTGIVERDVETMWKRHDELKERVKELEKARVA